MDPMREGILFFGSMTADINHLVDRWPEQDTVARILSSEISPGGPPQNCANALRRLGATFPLTVVSALGDDSYGDTVIRMSEDNGLNMAGVKRLQGIDSPHTHVMVAKETGRRTFFYSAGANAHIRENLFEPSAAPKAGIFYAGAPGLLPAMDADPEGQWAGLFARAREAGFKTSIEMVTTSKAENERIVKPCIPHLDYLIVNDDEAGAIAGRQLDVDGIFQWDLAARSCEILLDAGVGSVVAIHHPQGAVAMHRGFAPVAAGSVRLPQAQIVSTVGAGDAFSAGYHFGLHAQWPAEQCLALANAAAASSLRSMSTTGSIEPAPRCLDLAASCGVARPGF
jgi:sugar/nucleoside kinase (ribokinase family)